MPSLSPKRPFLLIALASLSLVALEILWTRIFSAEFFYTFAFLTLSSAVLGLGLGGLALRLSPALQAPRRLGLYLALTALLALLGPPLVLHLGLDFARILGSWAMFGCFLLALALLGAAFFTGGMAVSLLFRTHHGEMPRLYRADLLGAALGVGLAVLLMNTVGTPAATLLVALPLALGALLADGRLGKVLGLLLGAATLLLLPAAPRLVTKPRVERAPVLHRAWDAMALLKVYADPDGRRINIDNTANTPVWPFDGNWEALKAQPDAFFLDPKPLMDRQPGCRFLSIGSGGGGDVLMALKNGAAEVHAVEVNPTINRMLLPGGLLFGDSGRLYADPRVKVVTEDARTYLRRHSGAFDLAYSFSSNTFAALASGAFALAENYLFTVEAFQDAYAALSPRGFLVMEHQFYVPRLAGEALEGLRRSGVAHPERHLAVYASPVTRRQILLVGKAPLDRAAVEDAFLALRSRDFKLMHRVFPDPEPGASPLVDTLVRKGWRAAAGQHPTDLSPATDDRPFTAQQGLWRNLRPSGLKKLESFEFRGFPLSKLIIAAVLALSLLVVVPLNLLPYLRRGPKLLAPGWLYFFVIGLAFMAVEVVLIQTTTLFIGPSAYTLVAILFTLLVASGLGSRLAGKVPDALPFLAIPALLLLHILAFAPLARALCGLPLAGRMAVTVFLVAPLGFFMGMPFPKGTARVGELVDWGFAVNGAASVIGSAAVLLLSFAWGFRVALAAGGAAYLLALLLLAGRRPWVRPA